MLRKLSTVVLFTILILMFVLSGSGEKEGEQGPQSLHRGFFEVYEEEGFWVALTYFDSFHREFSPEERIQYSWGILSAMAEYSERFSFIKEISPQCIYTPVVFTFVDYLYEGLYSTEYNTFKAGFFQEEEQQERILQLKDNEVFTLVKTYGFVGETPIEDYGFAVLMQPGLYEIVEKSREILWESGVSDSDIAEEGIPEFFGFSVPTDILPQDAVQWESTAKYPEILLHDPDQLSLLEGSWKVLGYIPVRIVD